MFLIKLKYSVSALCSPSSKLQLMLAFFLACSSSSEQLPLPQTADVAPLRRLTIEQYNNTLRDVFPEAVLPRFSFSEVVVSGFYDNNTDLNSASMTTVTGYQQASFLVIETLSEQNYFPFCDSTACVNQFLLGEAEQLWRRKLKRKEKDELRNLFGEWEQELGASLTLQMGLQYLLISPEFLYFPELGTGEIDSKLDRMPLSDAEIANRLSYFLWNTAPDAQLRKLANQGKLSTRDEIAEQAWNMMSDVRANQGFLRFLVQWLQLDQIGSDIIDFDKIFIIDEDDSEVISDYLHQVLQPQMRQEAEIFLLRHILEGEGTLKTILTSNKSYISYPLAELYDVDIPSSSAPFVWSTYLEALASTDDSEGFLYEELYYPINLPKSERSGILTTLGILHKKTKPSHPSPVQRGVFVMEQILCIDPVPPPDDVPPLETEEGQEPLTNRERYEQHSTNPACAGCHQIMDGIGYTFENYDPLGRYRTTENGIEIDASGELIGPDVAGKLDNALHLSQKLAESRTVHDCVTEHWVEYALGRNGWNNQDEQLLNYLKEGFWLSGGDIPELVVNIVTSPSFRYIHPPTE
ncbi:MAG: hypothetical protein CMK59_11240 [Proteobacteria bacterium]|nr:hypothetical protein [Pseudomonadota bacterium]